MWTPATIAVGDFGVFLFFFKHVIFSMFPIEALKTKKGGGKKALCNST